MLLKEERVAECLMSWGRLFQMWGPKCEKVRKPWVLQLRPTCKIYLANVWNGAKFKPEISSSFLIWLRQVWYYGGDYVYFTRLVCICGRTTKSLRWPKVCGTCCACAPMVNKASHHQRFRRSLAFWTRWWRRRNSASSRRWSKWGQNTMQGWRGWVVERQVTVLTVRLIGISGRGHTSKILLYSSHCLVACSCSTWILLCVTIIIVLLHAAVVPGSWCVLQ